MLRGLDAGTEELGQAERELIEQLGRRVRLAVPLRVVLGREAEVGAEIHDVGHAVAEADEVADHVLRLTVRQAQEHDVEPREVRRLHRHVLEARVAGGERRIEVADRRARVRVRGDVHDVDVRMPGKQPEQLGPRVP